VICRLCRPPPTSASRWSAVKSTAPAAGTGRASKAQKGRTGCATNKVQRAAAGRGLRAERGAHPGWAVPHIWKYVKNLKRTAGIVGIDHRPAGVPALLHCPARRRIRAVCDPAQGIRRDHEGPHNIFCRRREDARRTSRRFPGPQVQEIVQRLHATPKAIVEKARAAIRRRDVRETNVIFDRSS